MPLRIDISDVAIEKTEAIHQLHVWGVKTSRWKNNCIKTPLNSRPSPNHRRAAVMHSEAPSLDLVWAEIRDDHILELAVINPAMEDNDLLNKLGHGIAIGFSPTMMDPDSVVDTKWRNQALTDILGPGHKVLWPGPVIFFSYGYDVSDYVKVGPNQPDVAKHNRFRSLWETDHGKGNDMQNEGNDSCSVGEMVWKWKVKERGTSMRVLDLSRRDLSAILDYTAYSQLNPIPSSSMFAGSNAFHCVHVLDLNNPGYSLKNLWTEIDPAAPLIASKIPRGVLTFQNPRGDNLSFYFVGLPTWPNPLQAMLGAFAVGLPWLIHYSMDINPPFRGNMPRATRWPLADLLWSIDFPSHDSANRAMLEAATKADADPYTGEDRDVQQASAPSLRPPGGRGSDTTDAAPLLHIYRPTHACDSITVVHALGAELRPDHVRALYKYLRHTRPTLWSRHGADGFENYWHVYARVHLRGEAATTAAAESPYAITRRAEEKVQEKQERKGKGKQEVGDERNGGGWRNDPMLARIMAHMTLERFTGEDAVKSGERRAQIERRRRALLKVIEWWRTKGPGREGPPAEGGH
ncbi:hypothetical protein MYCTH_2112484 [Thermothelomyces thermophilus ATCC 42464]|uniref:Uncharacterized protein n=1 Tax=Thermothelomyces thermophilus (strain ATCC 42464 / BCRC 31852 / DSM 1799) TaxID=573729 RepID=G2QIY7_THET4|nr:uncharacterized protein MYCTH_2112484 [Thermothelomyces thermophilus ATCC 42464]AEO60406.1 hypothetical protein MYCTH_2112484 [Thermothelomyces thermophilus ATCC 42464]